MIPLIRQREGFVDEQFFGNKLLDTSLELVQNQRAIRQGIATKHEFKSGIWKKAKNQLLQESNDKCAYCESPVSVVAYGDVEHYRPKSKYWWLAYCLENYLASCAICNQRFKSNHFPILGTKLSAPRIRSNNTDSRLEQIASSLVPSPFEQTEIDEFIQTHLNEQSLLVNPYLDNPSDSFSWHADRVLEEVELIPANNSDIAKQRVKAAIDNYGLDRSELRRLRYSTFDSYFINKITLQDTSINSETRRINEERIARMLQDNHPYAGVIRFFEENGTPEDWIRSGYLTM